MLLNNGSMKKTKNQKIQRDENRNIIVQNFWDVAKTVLR